MALIAPLSSDFGNALSFRMTLKKVENCFRKTASISFLQVSPQYLHLSGHEQHTYLEGFLVDNGHSDSIHFALGYKAPYTHGVL